VSWLSQFVHNPGQFITHEPLKALGLLGAPIAAIAAPFVLPELGTALGIGGGAAEAGLAGGEAALAGGEGALGLGTFGADSLLPAAATETAGLLPEGSSLLPFGESAGSLGEAGAGSVADFYNAVGAPGGTSLSTAGTTVPDLSYLEPEAASGAASGVPQAAGAISPEMAAGAPFADSAVGQAMVNAGLVPANASPGMWSSAMSWIKANPMMAATLGLGGLGLAKNLIGGIPQSGALKGVAGQAGQQAGALSAEGQNLLGPIQGGPLPPALEQQVLNGVQAADAATKSRFAQLGLSGSTMETDALNNNRNQAEALRGTLALQLAQSGAQLLSIANQDLGIEAGVFTSLMNAQIAQDSALEQSIARFAGSAAMASAISSRRAA